MNNGYIEIMMPEHPNARTNGTVLEHRLVTEKNLGRYLKPEEVVHHIDKNRINNAPENLIVFRTQSDHSRYHKIGIMQKMEDGTYICPISPKNIKKCAYCGKYYIYNNTKKNKKYCSNDCYYKHVENIFKENRPSKEELEKLIYTIPFTQIGFIYDVSDNTIRKWCIKYNLPYKYEELHPKKETFKNPRYIVDDRYIIKSIDKDLKEIFFESIDEAVNFIKNNHAKSTSTLRSIRTRITDSAKHGTKYFGYNFYIINKDDLVINKSIA